MLLRMTALASTATALLIGMSACGTDSGASAPAAGESLAPVAASEPDEVTCPAGTSRVVATAKSRVNRPPVRSSRAALEHFVSRQSRYGAERAFYLVDNFERVGAESDTNRVRYVGHRPDRSAFVTVLMRRSPSSGDWRRREATFCEAGRLAALGSFSSPEVTCPNSLQAVNIALDVGPARPPYATTPEQALDRALRDKAASDQPEAERYELANFERVPSRDDALVTDNLHNARFAGYRPDGSVFALIEVSEFRPQGAWYASGYFLCLGEVP